MKSFRTLLKSKTVALMERIQELAPKIPDYKEKVEKSINLLKRCMIS